VHAPCDRNSVLGGTAALRVPYGLGGLQFFCTGSVFTLLLRDTGFGSHFRSLWMSMLLTQILLGVNQRGSHLLDVSQINFYASVA
jgi:hypothetical protein